MAAHLVLTGVYVAAAALGMWGIWLAVQGIWHAEEVADESPPLRDLWRWRALRDFWQRRAKEPPWRRTATDAQILIGAGVFFGALGNIVSLWWV